MAIDGAAQEAAEKVDCCCDGCELFRIATQRAGLKHDVIGVNCLKDEGSMMKVGVNDPTQLWKEYMKILMNVKNKWGDSIAANKMVGGVCRTDAEVVRCAVNNMENGKANVSSGVVLEMLKARGKLCLNFLTAIFNDILIEGKLPEEWMLSSLVPIFKGEGDSLTPNSYKPIKLLKHAFKLYEKVV